MSHSATSLTCFVVGGVTILLLGFKWVNRKYVGWYVVVGGLTFGIAESVFGVYENVVKMLGRNPTLTDRTEVWQDVLKLTDNPLLGAGFESFWLGDRLDAMWAKWWWHPIQAHNGYIETYINVGLIGLLLLVGVALATFAKGQKELFRNFDFGRLRIGYLFAILVYNYTEAAFRGVSLVWTVFHFVALDYPLAAGRTAVITEPDSLDGPAKVESVRATV